MGKMKITLNGAEIQSGLTRVDWAASLIKQLHEGHEGATSWLLNYDKGNVGKAMRTKRDLSWDKETMSCETIKAIEPTKLPTLHEHRMRRRDALVASIKERTDKGYLPYNEWKEELEMLNINLQ